MFIHRPYQKGETIAAIATPPGEGGVAIVRISGERAVEVGNKVFSGDVASYVSHVAHFGRVVDGDGRKVDEGLLIVMRAPKSYTGEDTVEIQCHGGSLITRQVLDVVLAAGARAALPGEFTFKAFMNGKIDLAQAEAVQELIGAKSGAALKIAEDQLAGALSKKIKAFQKRLVDIAAILEAWVDFPEEDLEFASMDEVVDALETVRKEMERLSATFHEGKMIHTGISLCLAGPPNVGKSTLMNLLLGKERAIVTDIAGTTRDLLEDEMRLGSLHFRLIDTAGIRATDETIEKEGIRRSKEAMERADLILLVLDASRPLGVEEKQLLADAPEERRILIWNKIDLPHAPLPETGISISAKESIGLDVLAAAIEAKVFKHRPSKEDVVITNLRHKQALDQAHEALTALITGLKTGISPEFLSSDMRKTLSELGTVIGADITEDILTAIFSKFCIGK